MLEMFPVPEELTPEEADEKIRGLFAALDNTYKAALRGVANKARAQALDEALAVTMTSPYANAERVAMRIHTLERKSKY